MSGLHCVSIPVDMLEEFEYLSDSEAGAVIKNFLKYALDGIEPELSGTIGCVFRALRRELSRANEIRAKRSAAGKKGGRGHKKAEPVNTQGGTEQLAMVLDEPQTKQNEPVEQRQQTVQAVEATPPKPETKPMQTAFIDDDEAYQIQEKTNEVIDEAERNGFNITTAVMDNLSELVSQNGASAVMDAIKIAGDAGASNMRYLKGVLNCKTREKDRKKREEMMLDNPMLMANNAGKRLVFTPCG